VKVFKGAPLIFALKRKKWIFSLNSLASETLQNSEKLKTKREELREKFQFQ
jgi:hypothetical protein